MFSFEWPWLFLLLPLPLLIRRYIKPLEKQRPSGLKVPFYRHLEYAVRETPSRQSKYADIPYFLALFAWLMLITAAASPKWLGEPVSIPVSGRDLMLALDVSGSMEIKDMQLAGQTSDRLSAVKTIVGPFVKQRKGDRLGLIIFGERAYLQTPLTYDRLTIEQMIEESVIGIAGEKATAVGDAIGLAVKRIKDLPADQSDSRVLILLTDGASNTGIDPTTAAKLAKTIGLKIYTIGFGADEMMVRTIFGRKRINPSEDLDEEALKDIAHITGGQYFRARDVEELQTIYRTLDRLEPVESDKFTFRPSWRLFHWPLATAFIAALLLTFYRSTLQLRTGGPSS